MGKRKSSKPPPAKKRPKMEKQFTCPFCNHEKSIQVSATAACSPVFARDCAASGTLPVSLLSVFLLSVVNLPSCCLLSVCCCLLSSFLPVV